MAVVVSTRIVSKIGAFSANLGIGHLSACTAQAGLYKRDEFLLKVGFNRIIWVC